MLRMIGFLLFAMTLYGLMHLLVYRRLLRPLGLGPRGTRVAVLSLLLSWALSLGAFLSMRSSGLWWADLLQWAGYVAMGFFALAFGLLGMAEGLRGLMRLGAAASRRLGAPVDPARREALSRALGWGVLAGSGGLGTLGLAQAQQLAEVIEVEVPVPGLPAALEGFRIAQLSDIHVGPTIRGELLRALVERVNGLGADLVAVTGDLVDGSVAGIGEHVRPLGALRAPHGVFFVTGNHEYYSGALEWMDFVGGLGLTVLTDEHRVIEHQGARVVVAGVPDLSGARMVPEHLSDPALALAGAPAADLRLLLAHQPRSAFAAAEAGFDLMICGHTHGGQLFPYTFLIRLAQPFSAGLHALGRMWVYVNRGATWWGPPMRIGSPQEITLLVLRRA